MKNDAAWRKSSRSDTQGNACVELGVLGPYMIGMRDSKNPGHGHIAVSKPAMRELLNRVKNGAYDL